jgi:hypothetical protein
MKRNFLILFLLSLLFWSCDPMEDIYTDLDAAKVPFNKQISYTFTTADYASFSKFALQYAKTKQDSAYAKEITTYNSFGPNRQINSYIEASKAFFASKFMAYGKNSSVAVNYNYLTNNTLIEYKNSLPAKKVDSCYYKLTSADYTAIGATEFSTSNMSKLTNYIKEKIYPAAVATNYAVINFKFNDGGNTATIDGLFYFNGSSWSFDVSKGYALVSADYTSMGTATGFPGKYKNFDKDMDVVQYLSTFLKIKYTYALKNETRIVSYKYYTGSTTETRIIQFTFDGANWTNKLVKIDQYSKTDNGWYPDPTITFKMNADDYKIIVDYSKAKDAAYVFVENVQYGEKDWYYGSDPSYPEFQMKLSTRKQSKYDPKGTLTNLSDAQAMVELNNRLKESLKIVLENKASTKNAEPLVNGVQMYFKIQYDVYQTSMVQYEAKFKVVSKGQFECVSYTNVP